MKSFFTILILAFSMFCANAQFAADINLKWKANSQTQFVTKYIVYQAKDASTNFIPVVTVNVTNFAKVRVTSPATYKFKITAVNGVGESGKSLPVQYPVDLPTAPEDPTVLSVEVK